MTMSKSEIKKYKHLENFLNIQIENVQTPFIYKLNASLFILNLFVLFSHFLKNFLVSTEHSISFIAAFSHEDSVFLMSWFFTTFALIMTGIVTFTYKKYLYQNISQFKLFFKRLFSMKSDYNFFIENKNLFFPLLQNHPNRETVLVEALECLKENRPLPTYTAKFMLNAIHENIYKEQLSEKSCSYNEHVNQVHNFFNTEQNIQFFSGKEKNEQNQLKN